MNPGGARTTLAYMLVPIVMSIVQHDVSNVLVVTVSSVLMLDYSVWRVPIEPAAPLADHCPLGMCHREVRHRVMYRTICEAHDHCVGGSLCVNSYTGSLENGNADHSSSRQEPSACLSIELNNNIVRLESWE